MKYEEFLKMEKVCKKIWQELAETGAENKPKEAHEFYNRCPACEIASATSDEMESFCSNCPIDIWRNTAIDEDSSQEYKNAVCDKKDGLYNNWQRAWDIDERKSCAKQISELSWTFLPQYKEAKLPESITELCAEEKG